MPRCISIRSVIPRHSIVNPSRTVLWGIFNYSFVSQTDRRCRNTHIHTHCSSINVVLPIFPTSRSQNADCLWRFWAFVERSMNPDIFQWLNKEAVFGQNSTKTLRTTKNGHNVHIICLWRHYSEEYGSFLRYHRLKKLQSWDIRPVQLYKYMLLFLRCVQ